MAKVMNRESTVLRSYLSTILVQLRSTYKRDPLLFNSDRCSQFRLAALVTAYHTYTSGSDLAIAGLANSIVIGSEMLKHLASELEASYL